jgi:hypothetical protein
LWRADLYPDSLRILFREDFKEYVKARIAFYNAGTDEEEIRTVRKDAEKISTRIWQRAARASRRNGETFGSSLMIPAINGVIDAQIKREDIRRRHVPDPILLLLFLLCFTGSYIVGYANKSPRIDWVVLISYSMMTVMTISIILDLDRPRRGVIQTSPAHQHMIELLDALSESGQAR